MDFAEDAINGRPSGLYYLIHWKGETHTEDTWEPVEGVTYLRRLLKVITPKTPTNQQLHLCLLTKAHPQLQWPLNLEQSWLLPYLSTTTLLLKKGSSGCVRAMVSSRA